MICVCQSAVQRERAELEQAKEHHLHMIDSDRDELTRLQVDIDRQKV